MTVRAFSKDIILGDNQIIKYDRVLLTINGNGEKGLYMFSFTFWAVKIHYISVVMVKNGQNMMKFIFESFCMGEGSYIAGTGIEGEQSMDNANNARFHIHIEIITYLWKNINQTIKHFSLKLQFCLDAIVYLT